MTALIVGSIVAFWVIVLLAAVAAASMIYRPVRYSDHVLVNLVGTGNAIEGVVVRNRRNSITLAQARMHLVTGGDPEDIDGRAVVHRDQIEFVQVLPAGKP